MFGETSHLQFDVKFVTRGPKWAEIHDDLFEKRYFKSCTFTILRKIDPHDAEQWPEWTVDL